MRKRLLQIALFLIVIMPLCAQAQWWAMQRSGYGSGSTCSESGSGTSTFVICINNTLAGGNERGAGGTGLTSGVSDVFTQYGNVAGYVSPGRLLDGVNDYFAPAEGFWEAMYGNTGTWTLAIQMSGVTTPTQNDDFVYIASADGSALQIYSPTGTGKIAAYAVASGVSKVYNDETISDSYPTSGTVWIVMCSNTARNECLVGFAAGSTMPTKKSHFTATTSLWRPSTMTWPAGMKAGNARVLFSGSVLGGNNIGGYAMKVVVSNNCLIDLGS